MNHPASCGEFWDRGVSLNHTLFTRMSEAQTTCVAPPNTKPKLEKTVYRQRRRAPGHPIVLMFTLSCPALLVTHRHAVKACVTAEAPLIPTVCCSSLCDLSPVDSQPQHGSYKPDTSQPASLITSHQRMVCEQIHDSAKNPHSGGFYPVSDLGVGRCPTRVVDCKSRGLHHGLDHRTVPACRM